MAGKGKNSEAFDVKRDSFAFRLCFSIGKWFLVSLLMYLCSIPVFTAGTAYCAALAISREEYPDLRDIFGSYFTCFSAFFKNTVPVFFVSLLIVLLQVLNLSFYNQFFQSGTALYYAAVGIILMLVIAAVSIFRFYAYEVTFAEALTFRQRFSKAMGRMMRCLPAAGILVLLDIGLAATIAGAPVVFPVLFIYPGFHSFLTCILISWFESRGKEQRRNGGQDNPEIK